MIRLYQMDVLKALKQIPDESIDMQICSPPYWALRDYGSSVESIWDGDENCEHEWGNKIKRESAGMSVEGLREFSNEFEIIKCQEKEK